MPYLDAAWIKPGTTETIAQGQWIPERDWEGWRSRGIGLKYRWMWESDQAVRPSLLDEIANLDPQTRDKHLEVLGRDLGSVQLDSLLCMNGLEELKQSPDDVTASKVIDRMQKLGFTSVTWTPAQGGPPTHESLIPWKQVLDWMLRLMAKIGKVILKIADFLIAALVTERDITASVSLGAFPPSIGFDVSTELFKIEHRPVWTSIHNVLDGVREEISKGL